MENSEESLRDLNYAPPFAVLNVGIVSPGQAVLHPPTPRADAHNEQFVEPRGFHQLTAAIRRLLVWKTCRKEGERERGDIRRGSGQGKNAPAVAMGRGAGSSRWGI